MKNKYKVLLLSITIMLVLSILLGTSYSLWSTTNIQSQTNVVNVGCFKITFTDNGFNGAGDIDLRNQYPISDEEGSKLVPYKFSIKNECSIASSYVINLETSKESNFNLDYLKVKLNEETPAIYSTGLENGTIVLDSYSSSAKKLETGILEEGEEKTYSVRVWIEESATTTTSNVMGATWKGKVVVTNEATPLNNSKVTIVNNGETLNEEVVARTRYTYDLTGIDLGSATNIYCTNGAEPTMDNNTLVIDKIHEDTVCTTSNSIVDTITNKLSTTKTGIVMLDDEDIVEMMSIASGKEVVLDLNGKNINFDSTSDINLVNNYGTLTINDQSNNGSLTTTYRLITNHSQLNINGGRYIREYADSGAGGIIGNDSGAQTVINNGYFSTDRTWGIYNYGSNGIIKINDGKFVSTSNIVYNSNSSDNNIININGGVFNTQNTTIANKSGTINITNGSFESTGYSTIYNAASGTININGGIFKTSSTSTTIWNYSSGTINIKQTNNPIYIANTNSTAASEAYPKAIMNYANGNINIQGNIANACTENATDTTSGICIYAKKSRALLNEGESSGTISINGSTIISKTTVAIQNFGSGIINIQNVDVYSPSSASSAISSATSGSTSYATSSNTINICSVNLLESNKIINNSNGGYIYYHTNAFGSVTPTFAGTTANIQVKDDVCN